MSQAHDRPHQEREVHNERTLFENYQHEYICKLAYPGCADTQACFEESSQVVNVLLWGIVAVRLICPLSFESALSLIPSSETIPLDIEMAAKPTIDSGVPAINSVVNPVLSSFAPPQHRIDECKPASDLDSDFEYYLVDWCRRHSLVYRS